VSTPTQQQTGAQCWVDPAHASLTLVTWLYLPTLRYVPHGTSADGNQVHHAQAENRHLNSDASFGRVGVAGAGGSRGASSISGDSRRLPLPGLSAALTGLLSPTGLPPLLTGNAGGGAAPLRCTVAAWLGALSVGAGGAAATAFRAVSATRCSGGADIRERAQRTKPAGVSRGPGAD